MSGQLVGEVLDAAEAGHLDGLSGKAFCALLAIAEKCHTATRQGSVRRARIQAAIHAGNSYRTADRAIRELKDAGLVRITKRGYKAPNGDAAASVYELLQLAPPKVSQATDEACDKSDEACDKSDEACDKTAQACDTLGGEHDGLLDGLPDGSLDERARARGSRLPADWKPPPDIVAQMRSDHPHIDLDAELDKFRDYWNDQPGAKGRKVNWVGTYRNWIRREAEHLPRNNTATPGHSTVDQKVAGWLDLANQQATTRKVIGQ